MLCGQIEMPVSLNVLRLLSGEAAGNETPIASVASYRLVLTPSGPRYRFYRYRRVEGGERTALAVWHHAMLSAWVKIKKQQRPW